MSEPIPDIDRELYEYMKNTSWQTKLWKESWRTDPPRPIDFAKMYTTADILTEYLLQEHSRARESKCLQDLLRIGKMFGVKDGKG